MVGEVLIRLFGGLVVVLFQRGSQDLVLVRVEEIGGVETGWGGGSRGRKRPV